ncbi:MAG: hypothetical protein GEU98_15340 [Pseudonocardiaceae bacterium]|nr:hypothetical protein [Pseudonocardiaceae bacterium]
MGGDLTVTTRGPDGKLRHDTRTVATDPPTTGPTQVGEYDDWCEFGSVCGRQISTFIAEVKGNAAYGDITGVIGAFDFVVHQNFDGPWPRWRSLLIWDYGPAMVPLDFQLDCRINISGAPDDYCGSRQLYFGNVSSGPASYFSWYPSETRYIRNEQRLVGNTRYHDDAYGTFSAEGYYERTWFAPPIHTGRWHRCASSVGCQYYEVPWHP